MGQQVEVYWNPIAWSEFFEAKFFQGSTPTDHGGLDPYCFEEMYPLTTARGAAVLNEVQSEYFRLLWNRSGVSLIPHYHEPHSVAPALDSRP
jgi:hypothetical protein